MVAMVLLAGIFPPPQDGEVDRIMLRFYQRRNQARTPELFKALLTDTRAGLQKFIDTYPSHKDAERAAFHIAESHLSAGDGKKGLEHLRTFLKKYPASARAPAARFAVGEVLLQDEDGEGARAAFREFLKAHAAHPNALFAKLNIAVSYQNERKFDEAAREVREARRDHADRPESWRALLQLAVLHHLREKNADARAVLEDVIRDCPDDHLKDVARRHLVEYVKLGSPAPAFLAKDTQGNARSLEALKGRVVVLYFFDASMPAASAEAAFLRRLRAEVEEKDLEIVGISVDEKTRSLGAFLTREKPPWPILHELKGFDGDLPKRYGVRGLPALSVIDRKGRLRFYNLARHDLFYAVEKLLQEK